MKILIVKLSSLGDVVHAMPAVQDILRALPGVQIDWVVERGFASLVQRCQGVHRVIASDLRRWRKAPLSHETRRAWGVFKAELQQERYDAVIDLQGLTKSALIAWLARLNDGGKRYGLANQTEGSSFEAPARWVAHQAITLPAHSHAVTRSRELCAQALHYGLPDELSFGLVAQQVQAAFKALTLEPGLRGTVALVHGTSRADKQWPLAHWRELARRLNNDGFGVVLPHGSPAEQQTAHDIAHGLAHARVWPVMSLDVLTDALATCSGVIGVDSGLSHIAVALDLPHVQIYNFDTAWRTGPLVAPNTDVVTASPSTLRQAQDRLSSGQAEARQSSASGSPPFALHEQLVIAGSNPQSMNPGLPGCRVEPGMTNHGQGPCAESERIQRARDDESDASAPRQCSVFAQPTPSVDAVWQAWLGVLSTAPEA